MFVHISFAGWLFCLAVMLLLTALSYLAGRHSVGLRRVITPGRSILFLLFLVFYTVASIGTKAGFSDTTGLASGFGAMLLWLPVVVAAFFLGRAISVAEVRARERTQQ